MIFVSLLLMLLSAQTLCAQGQPVNPLRVGFTASLIEDVGKNDAIASMEVWMESMAKESGWAHTHSEIEMVTAEGLLLSSPNPAGFYDILVLAPTEFLRLEGSIPFKPTYSGSRNGSSHLKYGVIVSASAAVPDLAGLKGMSLVAGPGSHTSLSMLWLESALADADLPTIDQQFGNLHLESRAAAAIMQVFLGQRDACLVPLDSYATMKELNPQLGVSLEVIKTSPPLSRGILCVNSGLEANEKAHIEDGLLRLDQNPAGQSLLQLFRVDKIVEYDLEHLDLVRQLTRPDSARKRTQ